MDKNTIWAITLSTIVLVVFMFVQNTFFSPPQSETLPSQETVAKADDLETAEQTDVLKTKSLLNDEFVDNENTLSEQEFVITTDLVRVRFSNRGGDVIGYELLNHQDGDAGVEMAKNITDSNRAFSLALGNNSTTIINQIFNVKIIDDYTIGFYKTFTGRQDNDGEKSFTLGKLYSFKKDEYLFKLDITIDGAKDMQYAGLQNGVYTLHSTPQIGPYYDPKQDRYEHRTFMFFTNQKLKKQRLSAGQVKSYDKGFSWAGVAGKYFVQQIIPATPLSIATAQYSTVGKVADFQDAQILLTRKNDDNALIQDTYYVYMGPKLDKNMSIYNNATENEWAVSGFRIDESLGSGWLSWLEALLKFLMEIFYKIIPNWGVSIILMTILLKIALYPLTKKSSIGSLKMQELQPQLKEIQTKYKGNPEKLNAETAKFYKEAGYNPLSGCLPLLIQFPLIFAMFNLFNNYFEFRGAMFIPGWIPDLSIGDSVYIFPSGLPLIGDFVVRILPIIYVASQLLFTKITQSATNSAAGGSSMQMMMYFMPLIFFFMFYNAPAGLLLYWTVSNFLQLIQQIFINKMMHAKRKEMGLASESAVVKKAPQRKKRK